MKKIRHVSNINDNSRRNFIKTTALASAGFMIVPRHVLGGKGFVAPSDKLNIAAIGAGGKGESDLENFSKSPYVNIVALCDVDDRRCAKSRAAYPKAKYYKDFRKMLEAERKSFHGDKIS